jgi:quercetin dioxygenase-like cupin family protein
MIVNGAVRSTERQEPEVTPWGQLHWLIGQEQTPGAEQTLGVVTIKPQERNPFHAHPNCEELLYVISGECEHKLGDEVYRMSPGSVIRIPRGVPHWAKCVSEEPLVAVISFSAPDRQAEVLEGNGAA